MSHRTKAEVVLDSVTPHGGDATRLTSIYTVFPKMILGERNRHRGFSLSDRSSRAVPPEKLIAEVLQDPAMPAKFRHRAKGMGGGEELTGFNREHAVNVWVSGARDACSYATSLMEFDLAKEIVNRPLDPYVRMHSLMTATRDVWLNFFGLRLDAGADPTIQVLAQKCFEAYKASTPKLLQPGEWHLPFIDDDERHSIFYEYRYLGRDNDECWDWDGAYGKLRKFSAARCAHLSYNDLETGRRMTVERALAIYDKLVGSRPIHASPCEHQATPDVADGQYLVWHGEGRIELDDAGLPYIVERDGKVIPRGFVIEPAWKNRDQHGNLFGWRQARKLLPNESVAALPEGYEL